MHKTSGIKLLELKEFLLKTNEYNSLLLSGISPDEIFEKLLSYYGISDELTDLTRHGLSQTSISTDSLIELTYDMYVISYAYKKLLDDKLISYPIKNPLLKSRLKKMERPFKKR